MTRRDPDQKSGPDSISGRQPASRGWLDEVFGCLGPPSRAEELSDVGNAERLDELHRDRIRYVHDWATWIAWDGIRWRRDPQGVHVAELAKDVSRDMYAELAKDPGQTKLATWAKRSASAAGIAAMIDLARGRPSLMIEAEQLDADPWALGVKNGWIDLRTGEHHPPDPAKLMTLIAPVNYTPGAECPRWLQALEEWLPDGDVRDYFQRLVGEAIVGTVRDHHLIVHYGAGGNGKGTAFGTLGELLGPYFTVPHKSLLVKQRHEQHPTNIASLFRVRLAIASESDSADELSEEQVKELTGGDRLIARRMRENFWTFAPTHSLWLQTNHLPKVHGSDDGIWRRIRVMPWSGRFLGAKADPKLAEKLETELPGILLWAIEGALRWQTEGLTEPAGVAEATREYRQSEDKLAQFIEAEGWELRPSDTLALALGKELVDSFTEWHRTTHSRAGRGNDLAALLRSAGCVQTSTRPSTWRGITRPEEVPL